MITAINQNRIDSLKAKFEFKESVYKGNSEITFKYETAKGEFLQLGFFLNVTNNDAVWVIDEESTTCEFGDKSPLQIRAIFNKKK
jgi:hypothetical protein